MTLRRCCLIGSEVPYLASDFPGCGKCSVNLPNSSSAEAASCWSTAVHEGRNRWLFETLWPRWRVQVAVTVICSQLSPVCVMFLLPPHCRGWWGGYSRCWVGPYSAVVLEEKRGSTVYSLRTVKECSRRKKRSSILLLCMCSVGQFCGLA